MAPLLATMLIGAGFGAIVEGIRSAVTAEGGDPAAAQAEAKAKLVEAGFPESAAEQMVAGITREVSVGDRVSAGLGGALRGGIEGAATGAAGFGLVKGAGMAGRGIKSFLGSKATQAAGPASGAAVAVKPQVPDRPSLRKIRPSKQGEPTSEDPFASPVSPLESRKGPGVLVGEPYGGNPKLGMAEPRTVDAVIDAPARGIGMRDDAILNAAPEDIIARGAPDVLPRLTDRMQGATSFLMEGTPASPTIAPNALRASLRSKSRDISNAFASKQQIDDAVKRLQIEGEYEKANLLRKIFGG